MERPINECHQVIVTGGTGFIGSNLISLLARDGYEVIVLGRDIQKASQFKWFEDIKFIELDYHFEKIIFVPKKGASLIHLAWQGLPNFNSAFHFEENLPKNYNFIKELIGLGVEKVLVTGTCFEYGLKSGPLSVNTPANPVTAYGFAKDSLRKQLEFLQNNQPFILKWARLFYMYGQGQNPNSILAKLDQAIQNGDSIFRMSQGEQLRDYLNVTEVCQGILDVFHSARDGIFNVCSSEPISIRRLVENRVKELNSSIQLELGYYDYPKHEPLAFWGIKEEK
jgi:dTDP-6-deoxy-L-talose 4-dehydrogenase (NAD+)